MIKETDVRFVKKGSVVVVKKTIPDVEWSTKDVLESLSFVDGKKAEFEKNIVEYKDNIAKLEFNIKEAEGAIKINDNNRKNLAKFEKWALDYQELLLKTLVEEHKEVVAKSTKDNYVNDEGLTAEGNVAQLFARYQKFLATQPDIASKVASSVITRILYKTDYLANPFAI